MRITDRLRRLKRRIFSSLWIMELQLYFKVVISLAAWIAMAPVFYWLLLRLSLWFQIPTPEFWNSLIPSLIGFGVQTWKRVEEEEKHRREQIEGALREVEDFNNLLLKDLSEGARRYVELRNRRGIWQSARVQNALQEAWEQSPAELRQAMAFLHKRSERVDDAVEKSLLWAYEHLDDDWRRRIADVLASLKIPSPIAIWQNWQAIWELGVAAAPPGGAALGWDLDLIRGLQFLGLKSNPFGVEKAEADPSLWNAYVSPPQWERIRDLSFGLFAAPPGSGRTAAALLLGYEVLRDKTAFPIYIQITEPGIDLDDLAHRMAQAVARYIALRPTSFTGHTPSGKRAILHLLHGHLSDPLSLLRQFGLPSVGEGKKVAEEFEAYFFPGPVPCRTDLRNLLGEARPHGFNSTLILVDVQGTDALQEIAVNLWRLGTELETSEVILKGFLPDSKGTIPAVGLTWSQDDLHRLLKRRYEFLDDWCELRKWKGPPVEERLLLAAKGKPGRLIRLGNQLLRHVGRRQAKLRPVDLAPILADP